MLWVGSHGYHKCDKTIKEPQIPKFSAIHTENGDDNKDKKE